MKKLTLLFLGLVIGYTASAQQSLQYSQYMFNGLYINPAYAGYKEAVNMNAYYRSQWTGMPNGPQTMAFAVDGILNNEKVGLGLNIIHDKLGNERNLTMYANYAYRLQVSDDPNKKLAFGLGVGFLNSGFDNAKAAPGDPEAFALENTFLPDARFGVFYSTLTFFAGVGADNLLSTAVFNAKNNPNSISPVMQYYFNVGGIIPLSNDILFKPSTLIKNATKSEGNALTADLNAAFIFSERFTIGASYRSGLNDNKRSSLIGLMEVVAASNFRLGYSFDYSLNSLHTYTGGTHEISIGYIINRQKQRTLTPRYF